MKLTKILAAAAVVAIGATAQAGEQASDTYCVITLPVVAGYNLYGVAVNPAANANYAEVFKGAIPETEFRVDGARVLGAESAVASTAIWFNNTGSRATWYQFGVEQSAPASGYQFVKGSVSAYVFPKEVSLSDFDALLSKGSYPIPNGKANIVSIWDTATQAYIQYFWRPAVGTTAAGWWRVSPRRAVIESDPKTVPFGSAVFIQFGSGYPEDSGTFSL